MESLASNSFISTHTPHNTEGLDPVNYLPTEISLMIFSYLSTSELGKSCRVSRQWCLLASEPTLWNALDLRKLFPSLKVFDESDWKDFIDLSSLGLSVDDAPPSDKRKEIPILKSLLSSLAIERNAGVTVLTIPKGLTINKLINLAGSPKIGNATKSSDTWILYARDLGVIPVDKTYRIVITNNVLSGSRNLSVIDQKALVSKVGCEMPNLLELSVLLVVTFMSLGERLFKDKPRTYALCSELVFDREVYIGAFGLDGFQVTFNYFSPGFAGASAQRRF